MHWSGERVSHSSTANPQFGLCCDHGQVVLPRSRMPPPFLHYLLTSNSPQAVGFRTHIRQYNAALAFTSLGVEIDDKIHEGSGVYTFCIHGELYHRIGCITPTSGHTPVYAQLYIHNPQYALAARMRCNDNLQSDTMQGLQEMLHANHPYTSAFRHAFEIMERDSVDNISMKLCLQEARDRRRYNLPTADEIAGLVPGDGTQVTDYKRTSYFDIAMARFTALTILTLDTYQCTMCFFSLTESQDG